MPETQFSPRLLARALGVSESSVKRWVDGGRLRARRTRGGHRRIDRDEALRFARELGVPLDEPGLLGLGNRMLPADGALLAEEQLARWLEVGDAESFGAALLQMYVAGGAVSTLLDRLLAPAINRIGDTWNDRADGIFVEHRATAICAQLIHQLAGLLTDPPQGPVAVGGGAGGDPYMLPTLCAATSLRAEGFRALDLGANAPLEAFAAAIERHRPALIWLSVSSDARLADAEGLVEGLVELGRRNAAALIVGGRSAARLRNLKRLRVDCGANMVELAGFARGLAAGVRRNVAP